MQESRLRKDDILEDSNIWISAARARGSGGPMLFLAKVAKSIISIICINIQLPNSIPNYGCQVM
jgi:hypothetical protein